jgi:hypothetical protein
LENNAARCVRLCYALKNADFTFVAVNFYFAMKNRGKNFLVSMLVVLILPGLVIYVIFSLYGKRLSQRAEVNIEFSADHVSSTDHSEFEILQQEFTEPQQVTEACISCHTVGMTRSWQARIGRGNVKQRFPGVRVP